MSNMKALITGSEGFIGSHLTEAVAQEYSSVRAMVLYNSLGSWGWLDSLAPSIKNSLEVIMGDIRDPHFVREAVRGVDVVFHLAALIAIPYSYHAPASYVATNVEGTLNLLQAAREAGVSCFVHTSTSEVYGTAKVVPITEEHPLRAQSPYAATKIGADQLALSFHCSFGLPVVVARPFNNYGPRQSTRAVIPTIITQMLSGERLLKLGALTPTRDFLFVKDTAAGMVALAKSEKARGEVINLGSNFEISVGKTVELLSSIIGVQVDVEADARRLRPERSEVQRLYADISKAQRIAGWEPAY